jgi:hypothetical protein
LPTYNWVLDAETNLALKDEVKRRNVLEGELAAVKEQGQVDRHAALHDLLTGLQTAHSGRPEKGTEKQKPGGSNEQAPQHIFQV